MEGGRCVVVYTKVPHAPATRAAKYFIYHTNPPRAKALVEDGDGFDLCTLRVAGEVEWRHGIWLMCTDSCGERECRRRWCQVPARQCGDKQGHGEAVDQGAEEDGQHLGADCGIG